MRELVERTGVPRTTIHYYLREGLLPEPRKTARNAALYGHEHLLRLRAIQRLRASSDVLPLSVVRRVMELIDQGVEPETAVVLQRSVLGEQLTAEVEGSWTLEEMAEECAMAPAELETMVRQGVLLPAPGCEPPQFDGLDLTIARTIAKIVASTELEPGDLGPIADHLREASCLEMELRNRCVEGMTHTEAAEVSAQLQDGVNIWHPYYFFRARQHDIARHGLGVDRDEPSKKKEDRNQVKGDS